MRRIAKLAAICMLINGFGLVHADDTASRPVRVRDLISVEGVRDNPLIGYGLVVGLNGTGDRRQTVFTIQMLTNIMQRMGMQIPAASVRVNNVAAVFVTATLPPFAHPGTQIDVTVSSIGDAKSLEGGMLLLTPLQAADGQVYVGAQGPLALGGYSAGGAGNTKQVNHPTVARLPGGGTVERDSAIDLRSLDRISLLLRDSDYAGASQLAEVINREFGVTLATAIDGRRVEIKPALARASSVPDLLSRIEKLSIDVHPRARVIVNERTGTIVMGKEVRLGAASILHGNLSIEIATEFKVSQPPPFSSGETSVVPHPTLRAQESAVKRIELKEGASVEELVNGLQSIGATSRDVVSILQALKAAGALQSDLEVL